MEGPLFTTTDLQAAFSGSQLTGEEGIEALLFGLDSEDEELRELSSGMLWQLTPEYLPELVRLCPPHHRGLVAQILARQKDRAAVWVMTLLDWHATADSATIRLAIFNSLGIIAPTLPEVELAFRRGLEDPDPQIRLFAVSFLIDTPSAHSDLRTTLSVLALSKDRSVSDTAKFWLTFLQNSRLRSGR